jgi:restriction system protein
MARKKSSGVEDIVALIAILPWWAGVAVGLVGFLLLHRVAGAQVAVAATQPGQLSTVMTQSLWKGLATAGQFIVPIVCFAGAGISAWKRRERKALIREVDQSGSAEVLNGMTWTQFEVLVGEAFRLQDYTVVETGGGGADGGVDLVLTRGSEKFLVQCKQWKAFKVGVDVVRELYGVMAAKGAAGGFVVTSGRFTEDANKFASGRNVKLVDGAKLHVLIQQAQAARSGRLASAPSPASRPAASLSATSAPACPLCAKAMVKRMARRGANAGGEFWGCTGYPSCKGTVSAS